MTRFIEISEIPDGGFSINEQISASLIDLGLEYEIPKPIIATIDIERVKDGGVAKGHIKFSIKQVCSLCLENFVSDITSSFEIQFKPALAESEREETELEEEDLDIVYIKGSEIDLFDLIREQVFLSLPIKPVCSSECLGLCPQCGANLNREKCGCGVETVDPRFAVLKKIKVEG